MSERSEVTCDRCGRKYLGTERLPGGWLRITFWAERDEVIDLCPACFEAMREWVRSTPSEKE